MYNNSNKSYKSSIPLNLMTPEEFSTSPAKKEVEEFQSKEDVSEVSVIWTLYFCLIQNFPEPNSFRVELKYLIRFQLNFSKMCFHRFPEMYTSVAEVVPAGKCKKFYHYKVIIQIEKWRT